MLLLLLSCFSLVRLCETQWTAAHQAPPSLGFSRQEHWSGLPFPSPMHESEKWKWSLSVVSDSSRPHGLQPTRLLRPWDFPGKSTGVGCHCLLQNIHIGSTNRHYNTHRSTFTWATNWVQSRFSSVVDNKLWDSKNGYYMFQLSIAACKSTLNLVD